MFEKIVILMAVGISKVLAGPVQSYCEVYDYQTARAVRINDPDLMGMNFVYSDDDQATYFSLCYPLDRGILKNTDFENSTESYSFVSCRKESACIGLTFDDIITVIPLRLKEANLTVIQIMYKHPLDEIPIFISFPDTSIPVLKQSLTSKVKYKLVRDNPKEYEPRDFHNYSMNVKLQPEVKILDTYYFGTQYYVNSWIWAVVAVSFTVSSVCFHNYATTSGRLSSFIYFIYFYVVYRMIDAFYGIVYTPTIEICTTSVIIFPGVIAYIFAHLDNIDANYIAFGTILVIQPCILWWSSPTPWSSFSSLAGGALSEPFSPLFSSRFTSTGAGFSDPSGG